RHRGQGARPVEAARPAIELAVGGQLPEQLLERRTLVAANVEGPRDLALADLARRAGDEFEDRRLARHGRSGRFRFRRRPGGGLAVHAELGGLAAGGGRLAGALAAGFLAGFLAAAGFLAGCLTVLAEALAAAFLAGFRAVRLLPPFRPLPSLALAP